MKVFKNLGMLILLALVVLVNPKLNQYFRVRWSHLFIVLAVALLIARIVWVAVKG